MSAFFFSECKWARNAWPGPCCSHSPNVSQQQQNNYTPLCNTTHYFNKNPVSARNALPLWPPCSKSKDTNQINNTSHLYLLSVCKSIGINYCTVSNQRGSTEAPHAHVLICSLAHVHQDWQVLILTDYII